MLPTRSSKALQREREREREKKKVTRTFVQTHTHTHAHTTTNELPFRQHSVPIARQTPSGLEARAPLFPALLSWRSASKKSFFVSHDRTSHTTTLAAFLCSLSKLTTVEMARTVLVVLMAALVLLAAVSEARYLPTRADDSRLEEIRELLREILERTADGSNSASNNRAGFGYDKKFIYKRSIGDSSAVAPAVPVAGMGERMVPLFNLAQ